MCVRVRSVRYPSRSQYRPLKILEPQNRLWHIEICYTHVQFRTHPDPMLILLRIHSIISRTTHKRSIHHPQFTPTPPSISSDGLEIGKADQQQRFHRRRTRIQNKSIDTHRSCARLSAHLPTRYNTYIQSVQPHHISISRRGCVSALCTCAAPIHPLAAAHSIANTPLCEYARVY